MKLIKLKKIKIVSKIKYIRNFLFLSIVCIIITSCESESSRYCTSSLISQENHTYYAETEPKVFITLAPEKNDTIKITTIAELESIDNESETTSQVTHPIEPVVEYVFSLDNDSVYNESIEDNARYLVYRNLICSYTYCTQSLFDYVSGATIDGYAPIEFDLFNDYEEFAHFIKDTYTAESSEAILNDFRGKGAVFIQKDNTTLYDQNRTGFTTGPFFGEKFVIEITDFSDDECNFTYSPDFSEFTDDVSETIQENYSESEYIHNFKMIFENGKWKLDKMILAF